MSAEKEAASHDKGHGKSHGPPHGGGHEEGHEGAPEWLISFADNVTLMMGLFVILFAFAAAELKKGPASGKNKPEVPSSESLDMAIGIREGFNSPVDINSVIPEEQLMVQRLRQRAGLSTAADDGQRGRDHDVQSLRPTGYYAFSGLIPFEADAVELNDAGREAVRETTSKLLGLRLIVNVLGHASAAEAHTLPDRGLRLSFERAANVADALCAEGLERNRVRIIACGHNEQLRPAAYLMADHARNQRVEVVLTEEILPD